MEEKILYATQKSSDLPLIKADVALLSQAITNLLEPAVGYHYKDSVQIGISAFQAQDNKIHVMITSPISHYLDMNIMETTFPGSCISVSDLIIQMLGGQLQYRYILPEDELSSSALSQGTIFEFDLPIWKEE